MTIKQPSDRSRGISTMSTGSRRTLPSFPQKRESRFSVFVTPSPPWMPAFAGMTNFHLGWRRGISTIPKRDIKSKISMFTPLILCLVTFSAGAAWSADRLIGLH